MAHPDGPEWNRHGVVHEYLLGLIDEAVLKASGPLRGTPLRAGFLIIQADSQETVEAIVAEDPFAKSEWLAIACGPENSPKRVTREGASGVLSGTLYMTIYMVRSVTWMRPIWRMPKLI